MPKERESHVEDVGKAALHLVPGFSTIITFRCRVGLIALGEWLRADVVSAVSFEGRRRAVQPIAAGGDHVICFFQSPIAGEPVAANGDPVRGREVMKQSKKGPRRQTFDEKAATS